MRQIISEFENEELGSIAKEEDLIVTHNYVLYRQAKQEDKSSLETNSFQTTQSYAVFKIETWERYIKQSGWSATRLNNPKDCSLTVDSICWREKSSRLIDRLQKPVVILFILAIGMACGSLFWSLQRFRNQKIQEERKQFALQTLTHELRTPLTSLSLSSDEVLNQYEKWPEELKSTLLRMGSDIEKLKRIAESSKSYLRSQNELSLIHFNFQIVPSLREFLENALEDYKDRLLIQMDFLDCEFKLDAYWMRICIKNLVNNAFEHGALPVRFKAQVNNKKLIMTVADSGHYKKQKIASFNKSAKSSGLGLGLVIVQTAIKAMNGELNIKTSPTEFEIVISEPS